MKRVCTKAISLLLTALLLFETVQPALAYHAEDAPASITYTDAKGNLQQADESWVSRFPYGAFAFEKSSMAVAEGERGVIKVYRLGGAVGRATAFLTYEPVVVRGEGGEAVYDYAVSADDVVIGVEEPQPAARYQPVGKPADPLRGDAAISAEADELGYTIRLSQAADAHRWQILREGTWEDIADATTPTVPADKELINGGVYDYRCVYKLGNTEYCTASLGGKPYEVPAPEVLEPMPKDIALNAPPLYTPLNLLGEGEDPYNGWAFELIFADGEWVKELHIDALTDDLPEAQEAATFTIRSCEGGQVLESANTLLLRVEDKNEPEPSTLGFTVSELTADKAAGTAEVMIERLGGSQRPVSIQYKTKDGTALAGQDYAAAEGKLMFYTGVTRLPVKVDLIDDGRATEEPVDFTVILSELLGDDGCTLTQDIARVSLINSGKGGAKNLASLLYDPQAVDVSDGLEEAPHAASANSAAATGEQTPMEEAEPIYSQLLISHPKGEISPQVYVPSFATIGFQNPASAWGDTVEAARSDYWNIGWDHNYDHANGQPTYTYLYGAGSETDKLGSGRSKVKIDKGVALTSRNEAQAWLLQTAYQNMGATAGNTAGQAFTGCRAEVEADYAHDTAYLGGFTYYYSYTRPQLSVKQGSTTQIANPARVKRFGSGPLDKSWEIKGSDNGTDWFNPCASSPATNFSLNEEVKASLDLYYNNASDGRENDLLNDHSMIWLKSLIFTRRTFAPNIFKMEISTPNDANTAPQDCTVLKESNYSAFKPSVQIVPGGGGVTGDNRVYVGSTIKITAGAAPAGYHVSDLVIYQSTNGGATWARTDLFPGISYDSIEKAYTVKLMASAGNLKESDLSAQYKFRIAYSRASTVTVDFRPSVPKKAGSEIEIDPTLASQALSGYDGKSGHGFTTGVGSTVTYGYSRFDFPSGDFQRECLEKTLSKPTVLTGGAMEWAFDATNIQWVKFNLAPEDLLLINGRAYPGDAKIYLTEADFAGGMSVLYYHKDYQSAKSAMKTAVSWKAVYWDANGNGKIDGYFNETNGTFVPVEDEFYGYVEAGGANETMFAPKKNKLGQYCQFFLKACYTMTPRSIVLPAGASDTEQAQILPAFTTALNADSPAYSKLTPEQRAYRYLVSGLTKQKKDAPETRSSDGHFMYGLKANAPSTVDIPLGGDFSPPTLPTGAKKYDWAPVFRGNPLYPFAAPQPITIENSIAGPTAVAPYIVERDGDGNLSYRYTDTDRNSMNGYLTSFTGATTFALVTQEQRYTTEQILAAVQPGVRLGGGSAVGDGGIYVQSETPDYSVKPDSVTLGGYATIPDAEYLKQQQGDAAPKSDIDMDDSGSEMGEFNVDLGINLGAMELAVTDYVTILLDENKVGFAVGLPLAEVGTASKGFADKNKENWTQFGDFFKKGNFGGDESYKKASTERSRKKTADAANPTAPPSPYNNAQFQSKSFSVKFAVGLAFLFEYNPLDNGYYFEGMTVSVEAALSFRLQARLTVCPIVYFYFQFDAKIEMATGLGVIRDSVEAEPAVLDAKTAAQYEKRIRLVHMTDTGDYFLTEAQYNALTAEKKANYEWSTGGDYYNKKNYATYNAALAAYNKATVYTFDTDYKAFSLRFSGKLAMDVYKKSGSTWVPTEEADGFNTGFLSSDGQTDTQVVLKKQDGMKLNEAVQVVLRPLDYDPDLAKDLTELLYIANIKDIRNEVYWKGIEISPSVGIEIGAGIGVELLKVELYAKVGLEASFLLGVYNTKFDPRQPVGGQNVKYKPASVERFGFSIGLGLRVVILLFTFELDLATYTVDYDKTSGWKTGWHFLNDTVGRRGPADDPGGVTIRPPGEMGRQRLYSPADNAPSEVSPQAYDPTDPDVPFQLSGYGKSVDAARLATGILPGGDYKLVSAGGRDFIVYTISRAASAAEDYPQLVVSELVRAEVSAGAYKYGLANPMGAASPLYLVLDDDVTGDLDFDVWAEETGTDFTIHAAWVSYAAPADGTGDAQLRLKNAAQNTVLKSAAWSSTDAAFTAPKVLAEKRNYLFAPASTADGSVVFFGSTHALDVNDAAYNEYCAYLTGNPQYVGYLKSTKKSTLDLLGTQSALNLAYTKTGIPGLSSMPLSEGQTLNNIEFTKLSDGYYLAYTTRQTAYEANDQITEERIYLRKVTIPADGDPTWGDPYLLRMTRDYDKDNTKDGRYNTAGKVEDHESPYFSNLSFLTANINEHKLTGAEEDFGLLAATEHTFLLFEMNGATYIILDDSLQSIVTTQKGKIHPFFTGATEQEASGKLEVTIGTDTEGNLFAVYVGAVPDTTNNALWLSAYDADSGTWGDGVMLAMNHMDTYEASLRYDWGKRTTQAAYLGLQTGGGLLTETDVEHLYGKDADDVLRNLKAYPTDLGNKQNLAFSNIQAHRGLGGDLVVVTQGTKSQMRVVEYAAGQYTVMPEYTDGGMDSELGMYAVSYGKGKQKLGEGKLSFGHPDFSAGSKLYVNLSAVNVGDTAFRGSEHQPITAKLTANGQILATWTVKENIKSGQTVALDGDCAPLTLDLPEGATFVLSLSEFGDPLNGYPNPASEQITLFTVKDYPDLGVEELKASLGELSADGAKTTLNLSFVAANRGAGKAEEVYAQLTYGNGTDYTVLDLTGHGLTINQAVLLKPLRLGASTDRDLKNGILNIYSAADGNNDLDPGYGRKVAGTITVPSAAFAAGEAGYLNLRIELFSKGDKLIGSTVGVLTAEHDEYYAANNAAQVDLPAETRYTAAPSVVIPLGVTTLMPVSAVSSRGTRPALSVEEIDDVDGRNIGILNFKQGRASGGGVSGVLSITPAKTGTGVLHFYDAETGSLAAIAFTVTEAARGIDIFNDNGAFAFYNADGTPYAPERIGQSWQFNDVPKWGSGVNEEAPLRNNLALGSKDASFTFRTVAESMALYFQGAIEVTSDYPAYPATRLTNLIGGNSPTELVLGPNPDNTAHTVTIKVIDGSGASFDRLVERYAGGKVPTPDYDGQSPNLYWSRSFPATASIDNGKAIPLSLYVLDNNGLDHLSIDGVRYTANAAAIHRLGEDDLLWRYDFGNLTANKSYTVTAADLSGNLTGTTLIVDWFTAPPASGDPDTVEVPLYDADFRLGAVKWNGTAIGKESIKDLNITFAPGQGNTKTRDNTHEVWAFGEGAFQRMTTETGNEAVFRTARNGIYWTRTVNADNTWSARLLCMDRVDPNLPQVALTFNDLTGRLEWRAYKASGSILPITGVTINGASVYSGAPGKNLSGTLAINYSGLYTLAATDEGGNSSELSYTVTTDQRPLNLSQCTFPSTEVWNQARNNGTLTANLANAVGGQYNEADSDKPNGIYLARYEATLDGGLTWAPLSKGGGFTHTFEGLVPGDYQMIIRDAADHDSQVTVPLNVADQTIVLTATPQSATEPGAPNGKMFAAAAKGNTLGFEFAVMPVKEWDEAPTIGKFRALDTAETPLVWHVADNAVRSWRDKTFARLKDGWYLVAARGLYGATAEEPALVTAGETVAAAELALENVRNKPEAEQAPFKAALAAAVADYEQAALAVQAASAAAYRATPGYWDGAHVVAVRVEADPLDDSLIRRVGTDPNGAVVYTLLSTKLLPQADMDTLLRANRGSALVLRSGTLSIHIPKGMLVQGFDVNRLIVKGAAAAREGMVVRCNGSILPWGLATDGHVSYLITALGDYALAEDTAQFKDIAGLWGEAYIDFTARRKLFEGMGDGQFSPQLPMSRAMLVTVLWRMAGSPAAEGTLKFGDTPAEWYRRAILWAVENGIVLGHSPDVFAPDDPVSREQMCVLLGRFLGHLGLILPGTREAIPFSDANSISDFAKPFVETCASTGLIEGMDENRFAPQKTATRMEVSTLLTRLLKKVVENYCSK